KGMVLFCQADVTGRTESDPAAESLAANVVRYATAWRPTPRRNTLYAGDSAGNKHLEAVGLSPIDYTKDKLDDAHVLIVARGGGKELVGDAGAIGKWVADGGGRVLALGLDQAEARSFLPFKVETKAGEHIAAYFEPPRGESLLAGVGPADVHNRDPRELPLLCGGGAGGGHGGLAGGGRVDGVFCPLVPRQFDPPKQMKLKGPFRPGACLVAHP